MCPHCNAAIASVNVLQIPVNALFLHEPWRGVLYTCPACGKVLSAAIDPIAIKTHIVDEILSRMGRA
jgi:hypothetical protein